MTEPMTLTVRVAATPDATWRAITDQQALQTWFAEHAEVDLPNRFEFWGRFTPDGEKPQQRVVEVGDRSLTIGWTIDGVETTSRLDVVADGDSSLVTVTQSHFVMQEAFDDSTIRGVLQTFWCLSLANLVDYLEGRPLTGRHDFTTTDFRAEVEIDAPLQRVYDSLLDSKETSTWFGYPIEIEPWVGGRYAMGGFDAEFPPAKIIDLVPGKSVSVDWSANADTGVGVQSWELAESNGKTRLTFVQSGFDTRRPPHAGWLGSLSGVAELRRYHELADWRPIYVQEQAA